MRCIITFLFFMNYVIGSCTVQGKRREDMTKMNMDKHKARKVNFWDSYRNKNYQEIISRTRMMRNLSCVNNKVSGIYDCLNIDLKSFLSLEELGCGIYDHDHDYAGFANDVWGWTSSRGQEIVLFGCSIGTAFVDISDPINPRYIGFLSTTDTYSYWRNLKVYKEFLYVGSEAATHGVQIFSLNRVASDALHRRSNVVYTPDHIYFGVGHSHTLFINEDSGYLYVNGGSECRGGLHIADISATPLEPRFIACYGDTGYAHEAHCVMYRGPDARYTGREICVVFTGNEMRMLDVSDKCAIAILSTSSYTSKEFTHQGWFSEDHSVLVMGDEMDELDRGVSTRTLLWDASDLRHPVVVHDYRSHTTAIDHNQYIHRGYSWQSNYCAGFRVLNLTFNGVNRHLNEVAYFDTTNDASCNGNNPWIGSWSNYPFFSSGHIAVSAIESGLFIVKPTFETYSPIDPVRFPAHPADTRRQCSSPPSTYDFLYSRIPSMIPTRHPTILKEAENNTETNFVLVGGLSVLGLIFVFVMCICLYARSAKNSVSSELEVPQISPAADDSPDFEDEQNMIEPE